MYVNKHVCEEVQIRECFGMPLSFCYFFLRVNMHTCMSFSWKWTCLCVWAFCVCGWVCVRERVCVWVCVRERDWERESVCVCVCVHMYMHVCTCMCVYMHVCTCMGLYQHTQREPLSINVLSRVQFSIECVGFSLEATDDFSHLKSVYACVCTNTKRTTLSLSVLFRD